MATLSYAKATAVGYVGATQIITTEQSIAAAATWGFLLDLTLVLKGILTGQFDTGSAVAATAGVTFSVYKVLAVTTTSTTLTGTGVTSISVASANGISKNQLIALPNELVTVSAVSGTTLTISATKYAYSAGTNNVYIVGQTAPYATQLGSPTGAAYAVTTDYGNTLFPETGYWFPCFTNLDATNAVSAWITGDTFGVIP
jgi:hypothetical protein